VLFKQKAPLSLLLVLLASPTQALLGCRPQCPDGQECQPRPAVVAGASGGGQASVEQGGSAGAPVFTEDAALSNVPCLTTDDCRSASPPACARLITCDGAAQRCRMLQGIGGQGQCIDGDKRHCATVSIPQGVHHCEAANCDFGACKPCGGRCQPCCVGGCDIGYRCNDISNSPSSKCVPIGGSGGAAGSGGACP
jgi:hypothetical protein